MEVPSLAMELFGVFIQSRVMSEDLFTSLDSTLECKPADTLLFMFTQVVGASGFICASSAMTWVFLSTVDDHVLCHVESLVEDFEADGTFVDRNTRMFHR